jgi:hypothetical protein
MVGDLAYDVEGNAIGVIGRIPAGPANVVSAGINLINVRCGRA